MAQEKIYRPFYNSIEMVHELKRVGLCGKHGLCLVDKISGQEYLVLGTSDDSCKVIENVPYGRRSAGYKSYTWETAFNKFNFANGEPFGSTENDAKKIEHMKKVASLRHAWVTRSEKRIATQRSKQ